MNNFEKTKNCKTVEEMAEWLDDIRFVVGISRKFEQIKEWLREECEE